MPRPRRPLRRRTYRLRRRCHRIARPLRRPARVLVAAAVTVVAAVGLWAYTQVPPQAPSAATVRLGPDSTAVLEVEARGDAALAGLRTGDRLLEADGEPVDAAQAAQLAYEDVPFEAALGDTIRVRIERAGEARDVAIVANRQDEVDAARLGLSDARLGVLLRGLVVLSMLAFVGAGLALFVLGRARGYHASLGTALLSVTAAFGFLAMSQWDGGGRVAGPLVAVLFAVALPVFFGALPTVASALVRFPDGRYGPRWTRWTRAIGFAGIFGAFGILIAAELTGRGGVGANRVMGVLLLGVIVLPAVGLVHKYRRATDAVVRQQMKWAVLPLGVFVVLLLASFLGDVVPALDAGQTATGYVFDLAVGVLLGLAFAAVPLSVLAGALNFRPWDADLWIARSVAVGAATLGLAAVFAGGAEALRVGLRASMGEGAEAVAAALAAVVALAVFNPVREWLTKRADADLVRTRERLTERLPLLLAGRQVVATPEEIGRVAIGAVRDALRTDRAAVIDLDPAGWEVVAAEGVPREEAHAWAETTLDALSVPAGSVQVWEDPVFVLRVPLRSAEDELVGVLALGTHGKGRGYSTEERKALEAASRSLAEALRVAERRVEAEGRLAERLARLVDRLATPPAGDGAATEPAL